MKNLENHILSREERKSMTFKDKYGKCNSRNKRSNFSPINKDGFWDTNPNHTPQGYNYALGYTTETIEMCYKHQEKNIRDIVSRIYDFPNIKNIKIDY